MKVGVITTPNQKGQIVIPKQIRQKLGITPNLPLNLVLSGKGLYLYPVEEVIVKTEKETIYPELLKKTQGAWQGESWSKLRKKRRKIELQASQKRKKW